MQHGLVQRVLAHGDGGGVEHRIDMDRPVEAVELAIGAFELAIAEFVEIALDDDLGVGRRQHIVGDAAHHRHRLAPQGGDDAELVDRHLAGRRQVVERVRADREADRQPLAALEAAEVDILQVGGVGEVGAQLAPPAQHQPPAADIGLSGRRVGRKVDAGRDIGAAVELVLDMERQPRQVDVVAFAHDLVHRRMLRRHLDDRLRVAHAAHEFMRDLALANAKRRGQPLAAAGDGGDHLVLLGAHALEVRGLRRRLDHRAQVGERHRLVVHLDLADLGELADEIPQAEFFEVDLDAGLDRLCAHGLNAFLGRRMGIEHIATVTGRARAGCRVEPRGGPPYAARTQGQET